MAQPTYSTTASAWHMLEQLWRYVSPVELRDTPLIVVGEDGNSRPVLSIDCVEEEGDSDGITTGRAFVLRTGTHDDPHPMSVEGETFKALVLHGWRPTISTGEEVAS